MTTFEKRRNIERHIVKTTARLLLKQGFRLSVWNGDDEPEISKSTDFGRVVEAMMATDTETLVAYNPETKVSGKVFFVYGNDGYDVIADHTDTPAFNDALAFPLALAETYEKAAR